MYNYGINNNKINYLVVRTAIKIIIIIKTINITPLDIPTMIHINVLLSLLISTAYIEERDREG